jgi:predicted MPP superfamily phosphohydrolase
MKANVARRAKLAEKISEAVVSDRPLRAIANGIREFARENLNEANLISIEETKIRLARLPKELDGFRIVHLSDIHHSPFTSLEHITRVVEVANDLKPDMFVLTGDYVSHDQDFAAPVANALGELRADFGTHACLGNHDHWTNAELVTHLLRGEGINVLINEGQRLHLRDASFWLAGVDDLMVGKTDVRAALNGSADYELKLLLAHNPQVLRRATRAGIDLVLSGHTHGGQVKLRDTEKKIFPRRKLSSGLHRRKNTQIYITRGIGTVVVPVRYQCPPEVSVLELRSGDPLAHKRTF